MTRETLTKISATILASGWLISGILFLQQLFEIYLNQDASGVSTLSFAGFSFLNANATLYAYLNGHTSWIPGTVLASVSCACIAALTIVY